VEQLPCLAQNSERLRTFSDEAFRRALLMRGIYPITRTLHSTTFARAFGQGALMLIGSVVSFAALATAAFVFFTIAKLIGGLGNKGL
jgi:hypothetical protein